MATDDMEMEEVEGHDDFRQRKPPYSQPIVSGWLQRYCYQWIIFQETDINTYYIWRTKKTLQLLGLMAKIMITAVAKLGFT